MKDNVLSDEREMKKYTCALLFYWRNWASEGRAQDGAGNPVLLCISGVNLGSAMFRNQNRNQATCSRNTNWHRKCPPRDTWEVPWEVRQKYWNLKRIAIGRSLSKRRAAVLKGLRHVGAKETPQTSSKSMILNCVLFGCADVGWRPCQLNTRRVGFTSFTPEFRCWVRNRMWEFEGRAGITFQLLPVMALGAS